MVKFEFKDIEKRRGVIFVDGRILQQSPDKLQLILSKVIPVYVASNAMSGLIEYQCFSTEFEELQPNEAIPSYNFTIDEENNVKFERIIPRPIKTAEEILSEITQHFSKNNETNKEEQTAIGGIK